MACGHQGARGKSGRDHRDGAFPDILLAIQPAKRFLNLFSRQCRQEKVWEWSQDRQGVGLIDGPTHQGFVQQPLEFDGQLLNQCLLELLKEVQGSIREPTRRKVYKRGRTLGKLISRQKHN